MHPLRINSLLVAAVLASAAFAQAPEDPKALMLQARALQRRGGGDDSQGAVAIYRRVVTLLPESAEAHLRLAEALAESGDLESAVAPALRATELDPKNGEAWSNLGLIHYFRSRAHPEARTEARGALRRAARLIPNDLELWARLAEVCEWLQDSDGALRAWQQVGRMHPQVVMGDKPLVVTAWERVAHHAAVLKRYEAKREAILALCQRRNPESAHLKQLEDLAREQVGSGFLAHAEESFRLLGQHLNAEPSLWENIALIQLRTERFEEALASLSQAEGLRKSQRVSFSIGLSLMNLGRFKEAEGRWRTLMAEVDAAPEDKNFPGSVRTLLGTALILEGRPKDLLGLLGAWAGTSSQAELLSLKALALIQSGDLKAARTVLRDGMTRFKDTGIFQLAAAIPPGIFDEGILFKKDSRQALHQLDLEMMATLWGDFQQWDQCLSMALAARKAAPVRDVELLLLEANALDRLGRPEEAIRALREGQKLNPGHAMLQNNLGYLLLEKGGDVDEAAALIQASVQQDPKNGSVMDSWGWALFKQGNYKEAEEVLSKAAELTPFSPEVRRHLGETLLKLGRPEDALEQWERAMAYIFPERKALEVRIRELRVQVAKARAAESGDDLPPAPAEEPSEDENGEDPE